MRDVEGAEGASMVDVEEIKKLKARYFRGLDSKDWDLYRDVFTDDVVVDLSGVGYDVLSGRDTFMAYVQRLQLVQSVHHGHMPEIELVSDTTATGVWALEDVLFREDGSQSRGYGHYFETYQKIDGRWRIKTMKLSYIRRDTPTTPPAMVKGAGNLAYLQGASPVT